MQTATIITGANRGIGRAISQKMIKETAVLLVGRNEGQLKELCGDLRKTGLAEYYLGDVANPETAKGAVKSVQNKGWSLRNVVCNAGISKQGATATFDDKVWQEIFDVNVNGAFYFVKEAMPSLLAEKGSICFIPGTAGTQGFRNMAAYCASKHALLGLARSLALEVGSKGVTVASLSPGPVDTDMTAIFVNGMVAKGMAPEVAKTKIAEANGQKRLITPEEVAEMVIAICTKKATNSNGNPITINAN